jgi:ABC-type transporter Mla subunit MlaD
MQLQDILFAVTPLVSGVGAGAVLALVNQGLLHWTSQRTESLRMVARTWFDEVIWNSVGLDSQAATIKAVAAVERMAVAVSDAAEQQAVCVHQLQASTAAIHDSAQGFCGAAQALSGQIHGVPQTLGSLKDAIQASSTALENLVQMGSRAVANLDVSVAAFRSTVDHEFAGAARQQHVSSQGLADIVRQVGTAMDFLKLSSQDLKETVDSSKASFRSLTDSLEQTLVPGQQQLQTVVGRLSASLEDVMGQLALLAGQATTVTGELHTVFDQFTPAVAVFRTAVEHQFEPAAARHHEQVAAVAETVEQLKQSASHLSHTTSAVHVAAHQQKELADTVGRTQHVLVGAVESLASVASQLQTTADSQMGPSQRALHDSVTSFAKSAAQLSSFLDRGLGQAMTRLTEIHNRLSRLEGTFASLERFSRARGDIDRLTESLTRVADVTDAIANSPEGIRRLLQETAEKTNHSTAGDRIKGWFRTRAANSEMRTKERK